jgi:hypothetical protein
MQIVQRLLAACPNGLSILVETSDSVAPGIHTRFALREFVAQQFELSCALDLLPIN